MAYKVNHTDVARYGSLVVEDKTVNSQTSIKLLGKKYTGYSKIMAENLLHMMEHFANINPPDTPVVGQLWYNSDAQSIVPNPTLMMWDGTNWVPSAHVSKSLTEPDAPSAGDLWIDLSTTQLNLRTGDPANPWTPIGSTAERYSSGNIKTGLSYIKIFDDSGINEHPVIRVYIEGIVAVIISTSTFRPQKADDVPGFVNATTSQPLMLQQGINVNPLYKIYGTAQSAASLIVNGNAYDSSLFLRTNADTPTITNGLKITSNSGLTFGEHLTPASLKVDPTTKDVLLSNTDKKIILQTNNSNLTISNTGISSNVPVTIDGDIQVANCTASTSISTDQITSNQINIISKSASSPGKMSVSGTIIPSVNKEGSVGTSDAKWGSINAEVVNCSNLICSSEITGTISPTVTISNSKILTAATRFTLDGDIFAGETFIDELTGKVKLTTALKYNVVGGKNILSISNSNDLQITANAKTLVFYNNSIYLMSLQQLSAPIGSIILYAGAAPPSGYLKCDGTEYVNIEYKQLYSIISSTYGGGSGKFKVPLLTDVSGISYYIYAGAF